MFKEPYHQCIFTIRKADDLDECFESGGEGSFSEGRRWVEGQRLKAQADREGRPLLVLFADSVFVDRVLYHAILKNIEVPLQGIKTTYAFTDLLPVGWPLLHKTALEMTDGKKVSAMHIRPYIICRTPPSLLLSEEELFALTSSPKIDDIQETNSIEFEAQDELETRILHRNNTRNECYELLQDLALALPRKDNQKLSNLRSMQTGEPAWDDMTIMMFQAALEGQYGLNVTESEIASCVTIGDLSALMKSKIV